MSVGKLIQSILWVFTIILNYQCLAAESFNVADLEESHLNVKMIESYDKNGYLIIRGFFNEDRIAQAVEEYEKIVQEIPSQNLGQHYFKTKEDSAHNFDTYFFDSVTQIWPFYNSTITSNLAATDLSINKNLFNYLQTINKIGHNLHGKNNFFRDLILNDPRLKNIALDTGYNELSTAIFQTTIISKSPVEDSQYNAHQDGTFIGQQGKVLAYWIPLTAATKENGCLWGIPGSHKFPINWWYRKLDKESHRCVFKGQSPTWDLSEKVYLETNPGDLLIFPGTFIHGSDPSKLDPKDIQDLRLALTYHLGPTDQWDDHIWLKLSDENCLYF